MVDAEEIQTDVAIVGGGPSGLMLAIELGCRGVSCVLLEQSMDPPTAPKANATSSRTMEHYRRRGFAEAVRSLGLSPDHPQDVMYCTRLAGHELARFRIPSRAQVAERTDFGDYGEAAWPTPELPHRAQQMYIEPILRAQVGRHESVDARYGWTVQSLRQDADGVQVRARQSATGKACLVRARYAVGCDGARSLVRAAMGVEYAGASAEQREFFGGQMLSILVRSKDLYERLAGGPLARPAWQAWVVNSEMRGILVAINGVDQFTVGIQLAPGQSPEGVDVAAVLRTLCGTQDIPFTYEVTGMAGWTAGYMLVAEKFRRDRLFIAGDAAHLFTPTGGMGYNTSIDDAVNLGWKLAAACQGWGGAVLLDSYHEERHPIAQRNTRFARSMAESIGRMPVPRELEAPDAAGAAARTAMGKDLLQHARDEFNIPGLQLGVRYQGAIIASEAADPPPDSAQLYVPSGYPGARAPHLSLGEGGESLLDRLGRDFTLLCLGVALPAEWRKALEASPVPVQVLVLQEPQARALYAADLVLVRPDHHIAWRGAANADPVHVLRQACGDCEQ